jgi:hypothetical protein
MIPNNYLKKSSAQMKMILFGIMLFVLYKILIFPVVLSNISCLFSNSNELYYLIPVEAFNTTGSDFDQITFNGLTINSVVLSNTYYLVPEGSVALKDFPNYDLIYNSVQLLHYGQDYLVFGSSSMQGPVTSDYYKMTTGPDTTDSNTVVIHDTQNVVTNYELTKIQYLDILTTCDPPVLLSVILGLMNFMAVLLVFIGVFSAINKRESQTALYGLLFITVMLYLR